MSLRVTGVTAAGLHLIDAEMVALDLADRVELRPPDGTPDGLQVEVVDDATGVPVDAGPPEANLVVRALAQVRRRAAVRIVKAIPPGAGLGGGSADAAAVLRWAGVDDPGAAAGLGADVPFCVVGGRARVRGIGEQVEPLAFETRAYTLLTPPFGCSTAAVYAAWDALDATRDAPPSASANDLEPAALVVEPRLAEWRDRLGDATGLTPCLAGSGSTWFVPGEHPGDGRVVVHTIPSATDPI